MGDPPPAAFEIADWLVEPSLCRLSRGGQTLHLRPKLMDLLVFLASSQGRVVPKGDILEQVWRGEFVVESVLGRSIADLRQLLGDDAARPRFVETIPRRGYRLIAPVRWRDRGETPLKPAIAVLPFTDLAPGADQRHVCDGLAEELINTLCSVPSLRVIARTSAFAFRGRAVDVREIGAQLGASRLIEGAVQRVDGRLRITVQLIDAADGCHIWSRRFDRAADDLFTIEDEIARAVVAELTGGLPGEESATIRRRHSPDAEAHDLYLRGRYIAARRSTDALVDAAAHFERAIGRDPEYALAHAALAECHGLRAFLGHIAPAEGFPRALAAVRRAVQLDPSVAEAHAMHGTYYTFYTWEWEAAERAFQRAIALNPSYSIARMLYSHLLAATGRSQEALEEAESAQSLDPWSLTVRVTVGLRLSETGRFDRAIELWQAVLAMDPAFPLAHFHLGRVFLVTRRYETALAHLQKVAPGFPLAMGYAGAVFGRLKRQQEAIDVLRELDALAAKRHVGALPYAVLYQGLGDLDKAFAWYAKAFDAHEGIVVFTNVDSALDELRADSRFDALVQRLRFPPPCR